MVLFDRTALLMVRSILQPIFFSQVLQENCKKKPSICKAKYELWQKDDLWYMRMHDL